jgi:imidazole glycerol-phosphate synthase subunit HisH
MIAIIDYNAGNLTSVARALSHIGVENIVTNDIRKIEQAERIIFPGVGAAGAAMESLNRLGLDKALKKAFTQGKPILGICLGTQIILSYSEENQTPCLSLMDGSVRGFSNEFQLNGISDLKIPHMGWNQIRCLNSHPVLSGLGEMDEFYFVHSFFPFPGASTNVIAVTEYGIDFPSVIGTKNIIATQFHPEKSGKPGLQILRNFCGWEPKPC